MTDSLFLDKKKLLPRGEKQRGKGGQWKPHQLSHRHHNLEPKPERRPMFRLLQGFLFLINNTYNIKCVFKHPSDIQWGRWQKSFVHSSNVQKKKAFSEKKYLCDVTRRQPTILPIWESTKGHVMVALFQKCYYEKKQQ